MGLTNEISKRLGVGVDYSDKLKSGVRRLTYINSGIHVDEAYKLIGDDVQNIVIKETYVKGDGMWVDGEYFSSGKYYLRVYIY